MELDSTLNLVLRIRECFAEKSNFFNTKGEWKIRRQRDGTAIKTNTIHYAKEYILYKALKYPGCGKGTRDERRKGVVQCESEISPRSSICSAVQGWSLWQECWKLLKERKILQNQVAGGTGFWNERAGVNRPMNCIGRIVRESIDRQVKKTTNK